MGSEETRGTDQFRLHRVTLLLQVSLPIGEYNFGMTYQDALTTEPLTSNTHAKGVTSTNGYWEIGAIVVITLGRTGIVVRTGYPDQ